jgi:HD-GYP domain-containing protein (c-di-GMP phosphodiesterase class II)
MEHFDGSGWPVHKSGEEITQAGRIVAIANTFDELYNGRGLLFGRKPMKIYEVVEYIQNNAGTLFDPEIADEFVKHAIVFPNGSIVKLSDGRKGIVINQNPNLIARPIIRVTHGTNGRPAFGLVNLLEDMSLVINDIEI